MNRCKKIAKKYVKRVELEREKYKLICTVLKEIAERKGEENDTGTGMVHR